MEFKDCETTIDCDEFIEDKKSELQGCKQSLEEAEQFIGKERAWRRIRKKGGFLLVDLADAIFFRKKLISEVERKIAEAKALRDELEAKGL